MDREIEYPHFVRDYSEIADSRFVSSYMSGEDVDTIKRMFPSGASTNVDAWYWRNRSGFCLDDLTGEARRRAYEQAKLFQSEWNGRIGGLAHRGYKLLTDGDTFAVVKGNIKYNKHTRFVLLAGIPTSLKKPVSDLKDYFGAVMILQDEYSG